MTKKTLSIPATSLQSVKNRQGLERLQSATCIDYLAELYSILLGEQVSVRRALRWVHAQVAVFALLLLGGSSLLFALLLCVWAVVAVCQCRS